jgi:hypothetical protein
LIDAVKNSGLDIEKAKTEVIENENAFADVIRD